MNLNLKQPTKFTHDHLSKDNKPEGPRLNSSEEDRAERNLPKTKPISKLEDKKKINKKNEPSAIRLAAINETFHKIEQNADNMIAQFDINQQKLKQFLEFGEKCKCQCGRNIKYYCLKCMFKNPELAFPKVQLPVHTTIIHHSSQKINKSSILPMCLLSEQITSQLFNPLAKLGQEGNEDGIVEKIPSHLIEGSYILYPHKDSTLVTPEIVPQIKNIIVLDCTWFQTDQVVSSLSKRGLNKFIRLENYQSLYWRYNHHNDQALSSAEALIYFLREFQNAKNEPTKTFDPLMFLYCLNLKIVEESYRQDKKNTILSQKKKKQKENEIGKKRGQNIDFQELH